MTETSANAPERLLTSGDELRAMIKQGVAPVPHFFKLRANLPKTGKTDIPYVATDRMWVVLKTYAQGGENELHAHPNEDHLFLCLQGQAEFFGPQNETRLMSKNEFVMLPRGCLYCFKSVGDEPLVMLRVGAVVDPQDDPIYRVDKNGGKMDGFSKQNKHVSAELSDVWFE